MCTQLTYNPGFAQGIDNGSYFVGHSIFAVCIRWRETLFKWLLLWLSMVYIASSVALSLIARANPGDLAANPPIVGIFFLGLFIFSQLLRARARARARSIVKGDMQAYNALWEAAVRRDASQGGALEELEALVLSFQSCSTGAYCTGAEAVRQRMRVDPTVRSGLLPLLSSGRSAMNDSEHDDTADAVVGHVPCDPTANAVPLSPLLRPPSTLLRSGQSQVSDALVFSHGVEPPSCY
jgi:hypothetical protein